MHATRVKNKTTQEIDWQQKRHAFLCDIEADSHFHRVFDSRKRHDFQDEILVAFESESGVSILRNVVNDLSEASSGIYSNFDHN